MNVLEYQESFGKVMWQEGFLKELAGRSPEAQVRCFAFTEYAHLAKIPYQELEQEIRKETRYLESIAPIPERWHLIVKDGIVSGAAYQKYEYDPASGAWKAAGFKTVLPYERYKYDSTADNNGAGYKTRDWYKYLLCLPYDHKLW